MRQSFLAVATTVLLCVVSAPARSVDVSVLYDKPSIAVIPLLYDGEVFFQDYVKGSYRMYVLPVDGGSKSEVYNGGTKYLYPLDFGGSHAAWIGYTSSGTGGGGLFKSAGPVDPGGPGSSASYFVKGLSMDTQSATDLTSNTNYKEHVAVNGNHVAWTDYRHFSTGDTTIEVYFYDFVANKESRLTEHTGYKANPDIQGDYIVWTDYRSPSSGADIYLYDLSRQKEMPVCTVAGYQDQPCVYGDLVVWQDYRNAGSDGKNADIYLYDLSKDQEKPICTAGGYQCYPKIYGDIIVWHDYRNTRSDSQNADIYFYDLSTGSEGEVTLKSGYQGPPYLYGENIVWQDYTDNKIYVGHLGEATSSRPAAPVARAAVSGIGGDAPEKFFDIRGRAVSRTMFGAAGLRFSVPATSVPIIAMDQHLHY